MSDQDDYDYKAEQAKAEYADDRRDELRAMAAEAAADDAYKVVNGFVPTRGDSLRDRIAAALDEALPKSANDVGFYQRLGVTPLVDIEAYDLNLESLADAVIAELGLSVTSGVIVGCLHEADYE